MNGTDSKDSWDDNNDFLSGALHGAADQMPGGEVNDLNVSFGVVRDRVRRRRAAKIGGLTGASLVLVAGIAFGATQTSMLDRGDPVLPGTSESAGPEVSPSGAATQVPDPSPSGTPASSVIQDEYQPSWIADLGPGLFCGMPVADLETTAAGWSIAASGDLYGRTFDLEGDPSTSWAMAATVQNGEGSLDVTPVLVWSQDGVVVDLGTNVFDASGQTEPLIGSSSDAIEAQGGVFTTCAPTEGEAGDIYETSLPQGDYEVRVVAFPENPPGQWGSTVVSDPVQVRLDAGGAHTRTGTRGGAATFEPPGPTDGEISRFELDRTTDWSSAELTQRGYSTGGAMVARVRCESTNPDDAVPFEVVLPSTNDVLGSGPIDCDGRETEVILGVLAGGGEALDIRLGSVPDGVARLSVVLAPDPAGDASAACSADGLDLAYDPATAPSEAAGATAATIVEAALACDSDRMIELATEHSAELMFTTETSEQVFGLPEADHLPYETLVRLLTGTTGAASGGDPGNETIRWPRVSTEEFADSDEAWEEVVEAGLLTQEEADVQRADEMFGYTGMVIGIDRSGTWRYYSAAHI